MVTASKWAAEILKDDRVTKTMLAVALALKERCDYQTGENVAKTPATIAQEVGLKKEDQARAYVHRLETLGYLEDTGRRIGRGAKVRRLSLPKPLHVWGVSPPTYGGSAPPLMGDNNTLNTPPTKLGEDNKETTFVPPF